VLHEPAVADYVSGEDSGEATLGAFYGHLACLCQRTQCMKVYWCYVEESIRVGRPDWVNSGSLVDVRSGSALLRIAASMQTWLVPLLVTQMYGPAVRCKRVWSSWR
jgi:hypothetical protein